jgi:putative membrane protein
VNLILRWLATAVAVWVAVRYVPGLEVSGGWQGIAVIAAILGLANALVRPILKTLSCGLIVLTLGLFLLVINAVMLYVTSWVAGELGYSFRIADFTAALIGSLVISVVSYVLSLLLTDGDDRKKK